MRYTSAGFAMVKEKWARDWKLRKLSDPIRDLANPVADKNPPSIIPH